MTGMTENKKSNLFLLFAIVFVALAIVGGIRGYSPVPFWDMWDGYLGFYVKVLSGDISAWWAQHNEHRIILARCFFWLDFVLFAGQGWFLIVVNYLLLGIVCALYWTIWNESKQDKHNWIGFFLIAWLFWWIQKDNLEWGFQSQFILAQFLPLAAFYCLHRSVYASKDTNKWFVFAIVLGCLSIGSMANGVLALPIMTLYALITRMGRLRIASLGGLSVLAIWLYFYGYIAPQGHGSLGQAIRENPIGLLHYVFVYVGSAFSFGDSRIGVWTAAVAGMFLVASSVIFTLKILINPRQETLQLALLAFILYVGGTALGTAGGRLIFGVDQALASRYMTPSLMAWAALLILYLPRINILRISIQNQLWIFFVVLLLLMLPKQLESLKSNKDRNFERKVAALSLELNIKDGIQIAHVYPNMEAVHAISDLSARNNLSIFGLTPLIDLRIKIGQKLNEDIKSLKLCNGHVDSVEQIENEPDFLIIKGWLFNNNNKKSGAELISFVNSDNNLIGFGLIGSERNDVAEKISAQARYSGFKGYISANTQGNMLNIYDSVMDCNLPITIPSLLIRIINSKNLSIQSNVNKNQLIGVNQWVGVDFHKSNIANAEIMGSFINSDSDMGSVMLNLHRGDRIYYRTGPIVGRQFIEIMDMNERVITLPASLNWRLLEFSGAQLPETFKVKFTDNGDNWGEWSAIAIQKLER